jgi:hypothetical protein
MSARIEEYECQGCVIKLKFDRGAYWAEVTSGETWAEVVGPTSCPQIALCWGELAAWKAKIKKSLRPALIFAMRGKQVGEEFILASNIDANELIKTDPTGQRLVRFFRSDWRYSQLMQSLRQKEALWQELTLVPAIGQTVPIMLESYPLESSISLTKLSYCYILI